MAYATLAGGCFGAWKPFTYPGIKSVVSGYSGGHVETNIRTGMHKSNRACGSCTD